LNIRIRFEFRASDFEFGFGVSGSGVAPVIPPAIEYANRSCHEQAHDVYQNPRPVKTAANPSLKSSCMPIE
jgi:hypothetical protein